MNRSLRRACAALLILAMTFATPRRARADEYTGLLVGLVAAIVVVTVGITVGIHYAVHHKPSLTGCALGTADDLTLKDDHSGKSYKLTGDLAQLTAGQKVKVAGKKVNADTAKPEFRVLRVEKNFGACPAVAAVP